MIAFQGPQTLDQFLGEKSKELTEEIAKLSEGELSNPSDEKVDEIVNMFTVNQLVLRVDNSQRDFVEMIVPVSSFTPAHLRKGESTQHRVFVHRLEIPWSGDPTLLKPKPFGGPYEKVEVQVGPTLLTIEVPDYWPGDRSAENYLATAIGAIAAQADSADRRATTWNDSLEKAVRGKIQERLADVTAAREKAEAIGIGSFRHFRLWDGE